MKNHPKIIALAPANEDFNKEAYITNEAGWLTVAHLDAVEAALGGNEAAVAIAQLALNAANMAKAGVEAELVTATALATATQASLDTANATIISLNEKVKTLGKAAAGDFTHTIKTDADKVPGAVDESAQYLTSVDAEKARIMKDWPST